MTWMATALDWSSKGLTVLVVLLAALYVAWQCLEALGRMTAIGTEFRHFIRNRSAFDRWLKETGER